jgi:arylsulfatase A-like enzyme
MSKKTNVLFIITDQQYAGAMSCAGNPDLETPAMDGLAERGVRFEKAYCTQPLCAPCRASFITGLMPHQTGVVANRDHLAPELVDQAMGNLLRSAGYDCAYAGKWHIPGATQEALGFTMLGDDKNDAQVPHQCLEFLKRERENPFLLVASFYNPHDICQWARSQPLPQGPVSGAPVEECPGLPANFAVPPFAPDMLSFVQQASKRVYPTGDFTDEDWRHYRHAYYRMVEKVDAEIGVLLDGLRAQGLEDDTLVIFTSDHGDGHGAHRWNQKTALYEECVRIPFIISSKDSARVGAVDEDHLVSMGLDLIPTMCDYAGIEPPAHLPGQSLRPLLEGQPSSWRDQLTIETNVDIGSGPGGQLVARAIRTDRYKYSVYPMGRYREQLVDLEADPGEMVNLAVSARSRDILDDHRQRLLEWCTETDDPFLSACAGE